MITSESLAPPRGFPENADGLEPEARGNWGKHCMVEVRLTMRMRMSGTIVKATSEIGFIPSEGEDKCNYKEQATACTFYTSR